MIRAYGVERTAGKDQGAYTGWRRCWHGLIEADKDFMLMAPVHAQYRMFPLTA
ncbi:MAG: hypothetical protein MZV63_31630 [Marinilabiliales bacterium]|nr:hypothetical protein [Marinilabiliales bacterium]